MRLELDTDACQGHGRCYMLAPDLFDSDEYGHCVLVSKDVAPELESLAREGVDNCPEHALSLTD